MKLLNQQKELIIAALDTKEKSLISKVIQNPRIWNSESLTFEPKQNILDFSAAANFHVTLSCEWTDIVYNFVSEIWPCYLRLLKSTFIF